MQSEMTSTTLTSQHLVKVLFIGHHAVAIINQQQRERFPPPPAGQSGPNWNWVSRNIESWAASQQNILGEGGKSQQQQQQQ